jgi:hypothetical protein
MLEPLASERQHLLRRGVVDDKRVHAGQIRNLMLHDCSVDPRSGDG